LRDWTLTRVADSILWPAGLCDFDAEGIEEVQLGAAGDLDAGRFGHVADPQGEFGEMVEDHPSGRAPSDDRDTGRSRSAWG
jgi:hypothetical protein